MNRVATDESAVALPCNTLPFFRNPSFYGRKDIPCSLGEHLDHAKQTAGIRSAALWGAAGIGKSQIALEFANLQSHTGLQVIIWIDCGTKAQISNGFNKVIERLGLPDYQAKNTPDQNRLFMLQWLQKTEVPWLLILDNAEDKAVFTHNWPMTGTGSILVTCKSEFIAASPAAVAFEVTKFTPGESSELILRTLNMGDPSEEEVNASTCLAQKLGGLALALDIAAKQMIAHKKPLQEFLPYYDQHQRTALKQTKRINNPHYDKDLATMWDTVFESLGLHAARLLSLICFMAPDNITSSLFEQEIELPLDWKFLSDPDDFDEALSELLDSSLIRVNTSNRMIAIHRLIQETYYNAMGYPERRDAFHVSLTLLRGRFPRREKGQQMYKLWPICEKFMPHVQSFLERFKALQKPGFVESRAEFILLISDSAWYLLEIESFGLCQEFCDMAFENCIDKESLTCAFFYLVAGTLHRRIGLSGKAYNSYLQMLHIRELHLPSDDRDVMGAYSSVSLALTGLYRGEEALAYMGHVFEHLDGKAEDEILKRWNPDRFLRNRGRTYYLLNQFDKAIKDFEKAEYYQTRIHGEDSHYHGECAYELAKIAAKQGHFQKAYNLNERAYKCISAGKPTHTSVMATRYRQGYVCMQAEDCKHEEDRNFDEALRHLRDALTICQLHEVRRGNQGESARVKWRISQILAKQGRESEARTFRESAQKTKKELRDTGLYPDPAGEEESWDCFLGLLYR